MILDYIMQNRSILPRDETLTGVTISSQSGPGSNGNEEVTPYYSRTRASPPNAV